jgi:hypothetical protein
MATLGLPIYVTEVSIYSGFRPGAQMQVNTLDEARQAMCLEKLVVELFEHPSVHGIIFWGFWDGNHWIQNAGFYRMDMSPKASGRVLEDLLFRRWSTRMLYANPELDDDGAVMFDGVFGRYSYQVAMRGRDGVVTGTLDFPRKRGSGQLRDVFLPVDLGEPDLTSGPPTNELNPPPQAPEPFVRDEVIHVAAIGDYGSDGRAEGDVSRLVRSWDDATRLAAVVTLGDNNYPSGSRSTIEANVGKHYSRFMHPYKSYGPSGYKGAPDRTNRFFPAPGNHDWDDGLRTYVDYFAAAKSPETGEPRYFYGTRLGPLEFFILDSSSQQSRISGTSSQSTQANWLKRVLAASTATWKVVICHHPPYSSGEHGNTAYMQWPFSAWGAHVVFSGHDHDYERIHVQQGACTEFPYFVNGMGGVSPRSFAKRVHAGSRLRQNNVHGAQLIKASTSTMEIAFVNTMGGVVDSVTLVRDSAHPCGFWIE